MDAVNFTSDYKLLYNLHVQLEHPPPTQWSKNALQREETDVLLFQCHLLMLNIRSLKFNS